MNMGMNKSLVDKDGYPLANVNLYHVKYLRGKVRSIFLRSITNPSP